MAATLDSLHVARPAYRPFRETDSESPATASTSQRMNQNLLEARVGSDVPNPKSALFGWQASEFHIWCLIHSDPCRPAIELGSLLTDLALVAFPNLIVRLLDHVGAQ